MKRQFPKELRLLLFRMLENKEKKKKNKKKTINLKEGENM